MGKKVVRVTKDEGKVRIGPNVKDEGWGKGKPKPSKSLLKGVCYYARYDSMVL